MTVIPMSDEFDHCCLNYGQFSFWARLCFPGVCPSVHIRAWNRLVEAETSDKNADEMMEEWQRAVHRRAFNELQQSGKYDTCVLEELKTVIEKFSNKEAPNTDLETE